MSLTKYKAAMPEGAGPAAPAAAPPAAARASGGAGGAAGGDDVTTADEAATFSFTTRTGTELVLHQSLRSFNCGTSQWSAGLVLARYLEHDKALLKASGSGSGKGAGPRVLELGAGLGLAGIVAALQPGPSEVVLTDLESVVPYLRKNTRFVPVASQPGGDEKSKLWVTAFPWGESPLEHGLSPPYDVVLAADCIYDVSQVPIFLRALRDVCGPRTTVLVANEERDSSLQQHFVKELQQHFTLKPVKRHKLCELEGYHDLIELWLCKLRRPKKGTTAATGGAASAGSDEGEEKERHEGEDGVDKDEGEEETAGTN